MEFKEGDIHKFTLQSHFVGRELFYELHLRMGDNQVQNIQLKTANAILPEEIEKVSSLPASRKLTKFIKSFIKDTPDTSRFFAEMPTKNQSDRAIGWMELYGVTDDNEVYDIITKGEVEIGTVKNGVFTEMFFSKNGEITGRWLLRQMPNIFDGRFLNGDQVLLLWKPEDHVPYKVRNSNTLQESDVPESVKCNLCEKTSWWNKDNKDEGLKIKNQYMKFERFDEQLGNLKNLKNSDIKGQSETFKTKFQQGFNIDEAGAETKLSGIIAAEGTWSDMFGRRVTYTKEFINNYIISLNMQLTRGDTIGMDRNHNEIDTGKFDSFELLEGPISHIIGHGTFNGDVTGAAGFSTDFSLKAIFSETFQTWFALEGMTERVSLVDSPACKLCWLI